MRRRSCGQPLPRPIRTGMEEGCAQSLVERGNGGAGGAPVVREGDGDEQRPRSRSLLPSSSSGAHAAYRRIPQTLRRAEPPAAGSPRRFRSAMSMLTFYINRGGRNLPAARKPNARAPPRDELRALFGRYRPTLRQLGARAGPPSWKHQRLGTEVPAFPCGSGPQTPPTCTPGECASVVRLTDAGRLRRMEPTERVGARSRLALAREGARRRRSCSPGGGANEALSVISIALLLRVVRKRTSDASSLLGRDP